MFNKNNSTNLIGQSNVSNQVNLSDNQYPFIKVFIMWGLVFIGYFVFVVQWYSIGNFSSGWGEAFFVGTPSELIQSVQNATVTLGKAIGAMLAGYWITKLGHKYAVSFMMFLMVISFPFIIVAQNQEWNSLSIAGGAEVIEGTALSGFSMFALFRFILALGGSTLITYTNSIVAKMPKEKKVTYIKTSQLSFNLGAFAANIFFVIPGLFAIVKDPIVWTSVLSIFIALTLVLLIAYLIFGCDIVPRQRKVEKFKDANEYTFKQAFKDKEAWTFYGYFFVWLVSVVFITSPTMRNFIEKSPVNTVALIRDIVENGGGTVVDTMTKSHTYYWVWPAFVSLFVMGFCVSIFTVSQFGKTIFKRKTYTVTIFGLGLTSLFVSLMCGYFGGYDNSVALAFFLIFGFIAGTFLFGIQPVVFTILQQQEKSNAQYIGIIAGTIWGIGYFGYTVTEVSLSSIATYASNQDYHMIVSNGVDTLKSTGSIDVSIKPVEDNGFIIMIVLLWIILSSALIIPWFLPDSGYMKDGKFIVFTKNWNPFNYKHINFMQKEYLID